MYLHKKENIIIIHWMKTIFDEYLPQLINSLSQFDPMKIIVFGSYATQNVHEDSDLDLLIVLNINKIPSSYEEKLLLKSQIRKAIRPINRQIPIDLLVYTLPEYNTIINDMSSFLREIHETGKVIYEKAS